MTKGKDWTGDRTSVYKNGGFSNGSKQKREEHDYYATEPKATELLLGLDNFSNVWECACGGGSYGRCSA